LTNWENQDTIQNFNELFTVFKEFNNAKSSKIVNIKESTVQTINEHRNHPRKEKLPTFPQLLKKHTVNHTSLGITTKDEEVKRILAMTLEQAKKDCEAICMNSRVQPTLARGMLPPIN
jgi:hypothetical protein